MDSLPDLVARVTRFPSLCSALETVVSSLEAVSGPAPGSFAEQERAVVAAVRQLGVAAVGEALRQLDPKVPEIRVGGKTYRRASEATTGRYHALDGSVYIERHMYRQTGVRNGPSIDPIAIRAGIIERLTPCAAEAVGQLVQALPTREARDVAEACGVLGMSRATLQRKLETLGAWWERYRFEGADACARAVEIPAQAVAISVSVDRVAVPMTEEKPRPVGRPRKGAPKRPLDVVYHMAYCGCLTWYDAEGTSLGCIRYGEMPTPEAGPLLEARIRDDLLYLLTLRPDLKVVTLADGAAEMQHMLERITRGLDVEAGLIDFWHAVEYVAAALKAVEAPAEPLPKWRAKLRDSATGAGEILMRLRTMNIECDDEPPTPLLDAIRYFTNHRDKMGYAAARELNLPIGSGTVEATCKALVSVRMKRAGARWTLDGGQAVLALRALATSSMWTTAMNFLVQQAIHDVQPGAAA